MVPGSSAQYEVKGDSVGQELSEALPQEEPVVTDSARVRALLLNGWSVEDVARETGIGKGAVELMKEMMRRQTMG